MPAAIREDWLKYTDPFYCECRAFARLKELKKESHAVRVYGYVSLPITREVLENIKNAMAKDGSWSTTDPRVALKDHDSPEDGSWCIMGIVKDWVGPAYYNRLSPRGKGPTLRRQPTLFHGMLRSLKALHGCGIVVCDVRIDQWVDGKLVDLSCAMTIPHMYDPNGIWSRPWWTFASMAAWDLRCFQTEVINDWNNFRRLEPGVPPAEAQEPTPCLRRTATRGPMAGVVSEAAQVQFPLKRAYLWAASSATQQPRLGPRSSRITGGRPGPI